MTFTESGYSPVDTHPKGKSTPKTQEAHGLTGGAGKTASSTKSKSTSGSGSSGSGSGSFAWLTNTPISKDVAKFSTGGWAIVVSLVVGLALAETPLAVVVAGVLGVGIIYQAVQIFGTGSTAAQSTGSSSTNSSTTGSTSGTTV
jgi:hypothetical protein